MSPLLSHKGGLPRSISEQASFAHGAHGSRRLYAGGSGFSGRMRQRPRRLYLAYRPREEGVRREKEIYLGPGASEDLTAMEKLR